MILNHLSSRYWNVEKKTYCDTCVPRNTMTINNTVLVTVLVNQEVENDGNTSCCVCRSVLQGYSDEVQIFRMREVEEAMRIFGEVANPPAPRPAEPEPDWESMEIVAEVFEDDPCATSTTTPLRD